MKLDDIISLTKAGYNSQQIAELMKKETPSPAPAPAPAPAPDIQEIVKNAVAEALKGATPAPAQPAAQDTSILDAINGLKTAIQASNILNSQQPSPKQESVDDILSTLIDGKEK